MSIPTSPTPPPSGGGKIARLLELIAQFGKLQFERVRFFILVALGIGIGGIALGCLGAHLGNENLGALTILISSLISGGILSVIAGSLHMPALGIHAVFSDDKDKEKTAFTHKLFVVPTFFFFIGLIIYVFAMWTNLVGIVVLVLASAAGTSLAITRSKEEVWLPKIINALFLLVAIAIGLAIFETVAPSETNLIRLYRLRSTALEDIDTRENIRVVKNLKREYEKLASRRTSIELGQEYVNDRAGELEKIDSRMEEIRDRVHNAGGDGPVRLATGWIAKISAAGSEWGRTRWALALMITALLCYGIYTLIKKQNPWPIVLSAILFGVVWDAAEWLDVRRSNIPGVRAATHLGATPIPTPTPPTGPPPPVATERAGFRWPEARPANEKNLGTNKWEVSLDSRFYNNTNISVPDGARVSVTVTGSVKIDQALSSLPPEGGWSLPGRAVMRAEEFPLPSGNIGQALLVVGGTAYPLGAVANLIITKGGTLSFVVNDRASLFGDNSNTFKVTLELQ